MANHRSVPQRRPLITGVVAAIVLCGVWLLPAAHAGDETSAATDDEVAEQRGSAADDAVDQAGDGTSGN